MVRKVRLSTVNSNRYKYMRGVEMLFPRYRLNLRNRVWGGNAVKNGDKSNVRGKCNIMKDDANWY